MHSKSSAITFGSHHCVSQNVPIKNTKSQCFVVVYVFINSRNEYVVKWCQFLKLSKQKRAREASYILFNSIHPYTCGVLFDFYSASIFLRFASRTMRRKKISKPNGKRFYFIPYVWFVGYHVLPGDLARWWFRNHSTQYISTYIIDFGQSHTGVFCCWANLLCSRLYRL